MTTDQLSQYVKEQAMENPVIEFGDDPWSSESLRMDDSVFVYIRGSSPKSSAGEDERFDAAAAAAKR